MNYLIAIFLLITSTIYAQKNLKYSGETGHVKVTADGIISSKFYTKRLVRNQVKLQERLLKGASKDIEKFIKGLTWDLLVPKNYNAKTPAGLLVVVSPYKNSFEKDRHWESVLEKRNLILLSPRFSLDMFDSIKNRSLHDYLYEMIVFTGIELVHGKYRLDLKRVFYGDRFCDLFFGAKYADHFSGIIHIWEGKSWRVSKSKDHRKPVPSFMYNLKDAVKLNEKWKSMNIAFIQTEKNDEMITRMLSSYREHKFKNLLKIDLDTENKPNSFVSKEQLKKALDFLEKK